MNTDAADLYRAYQARHPRKPIEATPDDRKHLARLLTEAGGLTEAVLYLDWIHESTDDRALQCQGRALWPDGKARAMLSLEELSRKVGSRLPHAQAWADRGRKAADTTTPPPPVSEPGDAERGWSWAMELIKRKGRNEGAVMLFGDHADARRTRTAETIRELGIWARMCDNPEHFLRPERERFLATYGATTRQEAM